MTNQVVTGKLRYANSWWIVVDCDPELGKYYNYLYKTWKNNTCNLIPPMHGFHVTVLAGKYEFPPSLLRWGEGDGSIITMNYNPEPKYMDGYWWLNIECPKLSEIRTSLGLTPMPKYPFHMTIGTTPEKVTYG